MPVMGGVYIIRCKCKENKHQPKFYINKHMVAERPVYYLQIHFFISELTMLV